MTRIRLLRIVSTIAYPDFLLPLTHEGYRSSAVPLLVCFMESTSMKSWICCSIIGNPWPDHWLSSPSELSGTKTSRRISCLYSFQAIASTTWRKTILWCHFYSWAQFPRKFSYMDDTEKRKHEIGRHWPRQGWQASMWLHVLRRMNPMRLILAELHSCLMYLSS